jgi:SAM-dependent methyltransferase
MVKNNEWFVDWFDSPYYHILYKKRDETEAKLFIEKITGYLNLKKGASIVDLACGKGRHSITLNRLGYKVLGLDLSKNSIEIANFSKNETLSFQVHDMRLPLPISGIDCVFNLFTSIGYFENFEDNVKVINSVYKGLATNGLFVIDFFNAYKVKNELIPFEQKHIQGICFNISKKIENQFIIKNITFEDQGKTYNFQEKVAAIDYNQFEIWLTQNGFQIEETFGDYNLNKFDTNTSDRLIIVSRKIS